MAAADTNTTAIITNNNIIIMLNMNNCKFNYNCGPNTEVVGVVVVVGVRGKPRTYYSMLAYCTARFGRSNFGNQMPPRLTTRSALERRKLELMSGE
jgi:hypothetical protein